MKWPFYEKLKKPVPDPVTIITSEGETFVTLKNADEVNRHFTKREGELRNRHAEKLQDLYRWFAGELEDLRREWKDRLDALPEETVE